jgi:hypothetical protein
VRWCCARNNSQNLLMWWAAPEFSLRRSGHSPLFMALGRGGEAVTVVGIARIASGPFLQLGPGARSLKKRRPPSGRKGGGGRSLPWPKEMTSPVKPGSPRQSAISHELSRKSISTTRSRSASADNRSRPPTGPARPVGQKDYTKFPKTSDQRASLHAKRFPLQPCNHQLGACCRDCWCDLRKRSWCQSQ